MELHELETEQVVWSRRLDPHTTALALGDDALWIAEGPHERARLTSFDLRTGRRQSRWSTRTQDDVLIALAVVPARDMVVGMVAGTQSLRAWTTSGEELAIEWATARPSPSPTYPARIYGPRDLCGRWLRASADGELLLVDLPGKSDRLLRVADGALVVHELQIAFADEPGAVLWAELGRVLGGRVGQDTQTWSLRAFANDEWVWSDPMQLRAFSANAAEAISPRRVP